jgi:hypothetical protein
VAVEELELVAAGAAVEAEAAREPCGGTTL